MESKSLKIICVLSLMMVSLIGSGQSLEIPKNDLALSFSKEQLEVTRGEKVELKILILKSKSYLRSKAKMGISSTLPAGIKITFSPDKEIFESTQASITVQADTPSGQYMVILNATLNYRTKGAILKLLIK